MTDPSSSSPTPDRPGRDSDWSAWRQAMLADLRTVSFASGPGAGVAPLAALSTRDPSDPAIGLIEAWAAVADLVSFYSRRILEEGDPRTAIEPGSLDLLGRAVGYAPRQYVAAAAIVAAFSQAGASEAATIPAATPLQGMPAANGEQPVFETDSRLTVRPELDAIRPVQTLRPYLDGRWRGFELEGLGLGLQPGDVLLLSQSDTAGQRWLRLDVVGAEEIAARAVTAVTLADTLENLWAASGWREPWPYGQGRAPAHPDIFILRLATSLFGHDAVSWDNASPQDRQAAVPPGARPDDFEQWPGFGVDLSRLDLSEIDSGVTPGAQLLIEEPAWEVLGQVRQAQVVARTDFGLSAQVTRLTPGPLTRRRVKGLLRPGRWGHTATRLRDGRVLIIGGRGVDGPLADTRIYDPKTGAVSDGPSLPQPRANHTVTLTADNGLLVIGGDDGGQALGSILRLDVAASLGEFTILAQALTYPRTGHRTTILPDGALLISGGLDAPRQSPAAQPLAGLELLGPDGSLQLGPVMADGRYGHTATLAYLASDPFVLLAGGTGPAAQTWEAYFPGQTRLDDPHPLLEACGFHQAAGGQDGQVILVGGRAEAGVTAAIQVFSPDDGVWRIPARLTWPRAQHALLEQRDGRLLILGGIGPDEAAIDTVEVYDQGLARVDTRRPLSTPTVAPSVVLLADGQAYVAGGYNAEGPLDQSYGYDTRLGTFAAAGRLGRAVTAMAAARLPSGQWLITGGRLYPEPSNAPNPNPFTSLCSLYDPLTQNNTPTGSLNVARGGHTATTLASGAVLLAGGDTLAPEAELWDPQSRVCGWTGAMNVLRSQHTATLLANGQVLMVGGWVADPLAAQTQTQPVAQCEIFDPDTGAFTLAGAPLSWPVANHATVLTPTGFAMIIGGLGTASGTSSLTATDAVVLYDPQASLMIEGELALVQARWGHTATQLNDGRILVTGGATDYGQPQVLQTAEIYDPGQNRFLALSSPMVSPRLWHTATLLPDGRVLLVGGVNGPAPIRSAEIFDPTTNTFAEVSSPTLQARVAAAAEFFPNLGVVVVGGATEIIEAYVTALPEAPQLRRQIRVLTQSSALALAGPLDPAPVGGVSTTLKTVSADLTVGANLAVVGPPPRARLKRPMLLTATSGEKVMVAADVEVATLRRSPAPIDDLSPPTFEWRLRAPSGFEGVCAAPEEAFERLAGDSPAPATGQLPTGAQAEIVKVSAITPDEVTGASTVIFDPPLKNLYARDQAIVWGNLVSISQGETVEEVLGGGDPGVAFQTFHLAQGPLVSLDEGGGLEPEPALLVRVNGAPWRRVRSFLDSGPDDLVYRLDADLAGMARIMFGDGRRGARPAAGTDNITCVYRVGAGTSGNVAAGKIDVAPAQVAGIINPLPANGGVGPEPSAERRWRVPLSVRGLSRIVSVADFATFALQQPGVGKAQATWLAPPDGAMGAPLVALSLALVDGGPLEPGTALRARLEANIAAAVRPGLAFALLDAEIVAFDAKIAVTLEPGWDEATILAAAQAALMADYALARRDFGQPVRASDLVVRLQSMSGVRAVRVLGLYRADGPELLLPYLPAEVARWTPRGVDRAEILTAGKITLTGDPA